MIAVCLLSCERYEYTMRTARSFVKHNAGDARLHLFHSDDASSDERIRPEVQALGFEPLVYTGKRVGVTQMIRRESEAISNKGFEWILLLENDAESVRALPWSVFDASRAMDVYALRLFMNFKNPAQRVKPGQQWDMHHTADGESFEVGRVKWCNPPAISRVDVVKWLHEGARCEDDTMRKSRKLKRLAARLVNPAVYHIGSKRTPRFRN